MSKFKYDMGQQAEDIITGFKGIITGRCEHITGCDTYGLKGKVDKDGKVTDAHWIDEGQVKITGKGILPKQIQGKEKGGPTSESPRT